MTLNYYFFFFLYIELKLKFAYFLSYLNQTCICATQECVRYTDIKYSQRNATNIFKIIYEGYRCICK